MRRIIHNSTAILACLAILGPDITQAQAQDIRLAQAEQQQQEPAQRQQKRHAGQQQPRQERRQQRQQRQQEPAKQQQQQDQDQAEQRQRQERARRQQEQRQQQAERREQRQQEQARRQRQQDQRKAERHQEQERREQQRRRAEQAERQQQQRQEQRRERPALASGDTAQQRARNMPGLQGVLGREVDNGLRLDQLRCLDGGSAPCTSGGPMVTPRGVVVNTNPRGELVLAPANRQMNRVDNDGRIIRRTAEEGTRRTQSSIESARERRARRASALDDRHGGDLFRQLITERNSRRSSEEFGTSLRDAMNRHDRHNRRDDWRDRDDDSDSGSDLTKALVLGLGALAVGSMLNNNRQVALSSPDRVVLTRQDGSQEIVKDEVALLRQPGSDVTTENFDDGSSRTIVTRPDGSKVVTIRDADLRVLRRTLISPDGRSTQLIDDTVEVAPVDIAALPAPAPAPSGTSAMDEAALAAALRREAGVNRSFTLGQIRNIPEVRALVPPVDIEAITFNTGSAAIPTNQASQLSTLGNTLRDAIADNPQEIFLIEGHTDTVGSDAMNLALSDRRAESVALALSEYYDVPPENLVVQGYGEQFLKVRTEGDIRANRRATVRRITDLLHHDG